MKKFSKTSVILILIILIGIALLWRKYHQANVVPPQELIAVEVVKVKLGQLPIEGHAVGALVAAKNIQLTPEVIGKVAKILVYDGTFVAEGTPLIQLENTVNKAKADSARANLNYSKTSFQRLVILGKKGAIAQETIDKARADLEEKKATAKEICTLADKMLIKAPFSGVLGKVLVNPGEFVNIGQKLVSLTDTKNLRVEFKLSEDYLAELKIGQQVTITTSAYPGKAFYGKVAYIAPTINTEDRTISIYADVPNQDGKLTAGLFVNVTELMGNKKNIILIPANSLLATIDGQQVFKVVEGKAVPTPIKIGIRTADQVQVVQGIKTGDLVVSAGQQKIKEGTLVKIIHHEKI